MCRVSKNCLDDTEARKNRVLYNGISAAAIRSEDKLIMFVIIVIADLIGSVMLML